MASVRYGALITEIKGKVSGTVFQGSVSGGTCKITPHSAGNKVQGWWPNKSNPQNQQCRMANVPTRVAACEAVDSPSILGYVFPDGTRNNNLNYPTQQGIISQLSTSWRSLSPEDRASWSAGAVNFPFHNRFGETYTGSGYQVYQSLNSNLINSMISPLVVCPIPETLTAPVIVIDWSNSYNASVMLVSFPDGIPDGTIVEVWATPQRSAGRNSQLNQSLIASFEPQEAFDVPLIFAYLAKFGTPRANGKVKVVFGGKGQRTGQTISIASYDYTYTVEAASLLASITPSDRLKSLSSFLTTIALGNVSALSEITRTYMLYGQQLGDPWKLQTGGADAAAIAMSFNDAPDIAGVITGACDAFGNLTGFRLVLTIDTGAVGSHTATITLSCAAISFSQICTITWTSI